MTTEIIELSVDGRARSYFLVRHPRRQPDSLLLQLHGRGIPPLAFDRWTGLAEAAAERGYAVALPRAIGEIWNDGRFTGTATELVDDIAYLEAVIGDAAERLGVGGRAFVIGMSNGSTMAARFACARADRVAAYAQVAGTAAVSVVAGCLPSRPIPILNIHGTADRFAPYDGGTARGLLARLLVRRPAGPTVGVDDWARHWVEVNRADPVATTTRIGPDTTRRTWGPDVAFYRVEGGGHTWPGAKGWLPPHLGRSSHSFSATEVILAFFEQHRSPVGT